MDLQINFEETKTVATNVATKGGELQTLLQQITAHNNTLQSYWEGSDASKYSEAVAQQATEVQELIDTVNSIGKFIEKVSTTYEEAMNANISGIKQQ